MKRSERQLAGKGKGLGEARRPPSEGPRSDRRLSDLLARRRRLIVALLLTTAVPFLILLSLLPPRYTAEALLVAGEPGPLPESIAAADPKPQEASGETEVLRLAERLKGAPEAEDLLSRMGIATAKDLGPSGEGWRQRAFLLLEEALRPLRAGGLPDAERTALVAFREAFSVEPRPELGAVAVRLELSDPLLAAQLANGLVYAFLESERTARRSELERQLAWIEGQIAGLRSELLASERAVVAFRRDRGLFRLVEEPVEILERQLALASAERSASEARLEATERLVSESGGLPFAAAPATPLAERLRSEEAAALARQRQLGETLGKRHPEMLELAREIAEIRRRLAEETARQLASLDEAVVTARSREQALEESVARLKGRLDSGSATVELAELERGAEATRELYARMLREQQEAKLRLSLAAPLATVLSPATAPLAASGPPRLALSAAGIAVALLLALLVALALDSRRRGFLSREALGRATGVRVLGALPLARVKGGGPSKLRRRIFETPDPALKEAVRSLAAALLYTGAPPPPRSLLLTSALPGEGKSVMAALLARHLALSGRRVLLLDCDLRRPRVAEIFPRRDRLGLLQVLAGQCRPEDVARFDDDSGIDFITSGVGPLTRRENRAHEQIKETLPRLLASPAMGRLLDRAATLYDVILLDAPPGLVVSDALILSRWVEGCVVTVRWGKTREGPVQELLRRLEEAGAPLLGLAMTQVDRRQYGRSLAADAAAYGRAALTYY